MTALRPIAQRIRHLPGLERAEWFWRLLRKPYHWLLNRGGRGVKVMVGGNSAVWMPPEFSGGYWEHYEPEAVAKLSEWVRHHPGGTVLDIGSSTGIFSAIALFAEPSVEVVAFDSDLASLAAVRRMCQHAQGDRLRLVYGFVARTPTDASSLDAAAKATEVALERAGDRGDFGTTRYICLIDTNVDSIPTRRLDDLFLSEDTTGRAMLIKCDVEGAELHVLSGASTFLRITRPDLLLSVHPPALPSYGHTVEDVHAFLKNHGYDVRCIAVDHEEHWWCRWNPDLPEAAISVSGKL
ncbi:MAG: FkbM family methyltransferase [Burkholderiales bacterium]|nr:FkbM family methyltransferase [Burkholderiales bacterium]